MQRPAKTRRELSTYQTGKKTSTRKPGKNKNKQKTERKPKGNDTDTEKRQNGNR